MVVALLMQIQSTRVVNEAVAQNVWEEVGTLNATLATATTCIKSADKTDHRRDGENQ